MFRTVPLSIIRSFTLCTQQWYMSYRFADSFHPDPVRKLSANLYDIPLLCVQWKTPDDGQRNSQKHVEFYSKNKFEKLVHLFGFITRVQSFLASAVDEGEFIPPEKDHWIGGWEGPIIGLDISRRD